MNADGGEVVDAESRADEEVRGLLEAYARAVGAEMRPLGADLLEIVLPALERPFFESRPRVREHGILRVGLTLEALGIESDAELAAVGSPLFEHLIDAIRTRGNRLTLGVLPPSISPTAEAATLDIPMRSASASAPQVTMAVHPVGKLLVRALVRAGATAEELLVESTMLDLVSGRPIDPDIAALADVVDAQHASTIDVPWLPERPVDRLLALMISDLERRLGPDLENRRSDSERNLATELSRIDAYYETLLNGQAGQGTDIVSGEQRRAFEAEHVRRREEEMHRHQLRATLYPVQLKRWGLLVQDATWEISTPAGRRGTFTATRPLSGSGAWESYCPSCGLSPGTLGVCKHDHVACEACSTECVVCRETICREHAPDRCHVDDAAVCEAHARVCLSCRRGYCTKHQVVCADGEHPICLRCSIACAVCERKICGAHSEMTAGTAPNGERALCSECVVLCEGGRNEQVGTDEVVRCATCDRHVCGIHQASCSVDERVHCSSHLRRADGSRRLVCEKHRAACAYDPNTVFATDEVGVCAACAALACSEHAAACSVDGDRFCRTHLAAMVDKGGALACERHRSSCYVDGQFFSLGSTAPCEVCTRATCKEHVRSCSYCYRTVCVGEIDVKSGRCSTCRRLGETDIPVDLMAAAIAANGGIPPKSKSWRIGRDETGSVVDVDLGWSRRLVFSVRHGAEEPTTVVSHSLLGSKRSR